MRVFTIRLDEAEVTVLSIYSDTLGLKIEEHIEQFFFQSLAHSATMGITIGNDGRTREEYVALMEEADCALIERIKARR